MGGSGMRVLDYASDGPSGIHNFWVGISAILLLGASLGLGVQSSMDEPFMSGVHADELLFYVGGGCSLVLAWGFWTVYLIWCVTRLQLRRRWLGLLGAELLGVFFVYLGTTGYLQDVGWWPVWLP